MKKTFIAVIVGSFAVAAAAQTAAPATAQDAAAARRDASAETVKKVTEDKGHGGRAADAVLSCQGDCRHRDGHQLTEIISSLIITARKLVE